MKVLLVDDNPIVSRYMSHFLMGAGIPHKTANSGSEALALFTAEPFEIVVSDLDMPNGNGIFLASRIRRIAPQTLLLAFSGSSGDELRKRAEQVFDKIFRKPEQVSELTLMIVALASGVVPNISTTNVESVTRMQDLDAGTPAHSRAYEPSLDQ